jgi:hypothetical protein
MLVGAAIKRREQACETALAAHCAGRCGAYTGDV